jgi:hypothetical protein
MTPQKENCPEFPHFGARYPDAQCHNGFLWDLDSSEEDGRLHSGGDDPCPFCNTEAYLEWAGVDPEDPEAPTREEMLQRIENTRKKYS